MSAWRTTGALAALIVAIGAGCSDRKEEAVSPQSLDRWDGAMDHTMGSGTTSTLLARATFKDTTDETLKIKRMTGDWQFEVKAKPSAFDVAVQSIRFEAGAQSGWHSHPGPVFIQVKTGTMTFYESDDPTCTPIVRTAGQGYLDKGEHAHIARNETSAAAENVVTYFLPAGSGVLKYDEPKPGNCPF